jgi:hypothetical protein
VKSQPHPPSAWDKVYVKDEQSSACAIGPSGTEEEYGVGWTLYVEP